MAKGICPVCDAALRLTETEAAIYQQVRCSECGTLLEVVEENPLELEEVFE